MSEEPRDSEGTGAAGGEGDAPRAELPTWDRSRRKRKANEKAEVLDDPFQRSVRSAGRFAVSQVQLVIGGLLVVAGAISGFVYLQSQSEAEIAESTRTLAESAALLARGQQADDPEEAAKQSALITPFYASEDARLSQVTSTLEEAAASGHSGIELLAEMTQAATALRKRDDAGAQAKYEAVLAKLPADHLMRSLAIEGLAVSLENQGQLGPALEKYVEFAGEVASQHRARGLWHQARVLRAQGDVAGAKAKYNEFLAEFDSTQPLHGRVTEALALLESDGTAQPAKKTGEAPEDPAQ